MFDTNQEDSISRVLNMPIQTMVSALPPNPKSENPEKFDDTEFNRWQQKMQFYLTTLHLDKFLQENPPKLDTDQNSVLTVDA